MFLNQHDAASYGESQAKIRVSHKQALTKLQLTKEEEASAGGDDMEVRREDQEKINRFSSLHQKETALEEELRAKIVSLHVRLCAHIRRLTARTEGEGRPRRDIDRARTSRRGRQSPVCVSVADAGLCCCGANTDMPQVQGR